MIERAIEMRYDEPAWKSVSGGGHLVPRIEAGTTASPPDPGLGHPCLSEVLADRTSGLLWTTSIRGVLQSTPLRGAQVSGRVAGDPG